MDVKFRTNDIKSNDFVWKEGMDEWKRVFDVVELKEMMEECMQEVQTKVVEEKGIEMTADKETYYQDLETKKWHIFDGDNWLI